MNTEQEVKRQQLEEARSAHARALLEATQNPDDAEAKAALRERVTEARASLRSYREHAAAGIVAQISGSDNESAEETVSGGF